jgi:hypothetical protein
MTSDLQRCRLSKSIKSSTYLRGLTVKNLPDILAIGEPARLIPVVADTRKEQRATSALLAVIGSVAEYGRDLLSVVGAPVGKTSRIRCFTEVEFKSQPKEIRQRPDGLIQVQTGKRIWSAIVEAKVGNAVLDAQQIEAYLGSGPINRIPKLI